MLELIDRPEIRVMFMRATDDQASISRAWAELEDAVGSLRGRKFYGTFDPVELARQSTPDSGRLSIEFYRRREEIDLLLPVI